MDRNRIMNMVLTVLTAAVLAVWAPADSYAQEYISTPVSISKVFKTIGTLSCGLYRARPDLYRAR